MASITRRLNTWLDNQVRRHGLAYVLVPERHKDGAIHFHGFFNDAVKAVDSGHRDREGHPVYNLPAWSLGFTTAIELYGDYHAAVGYVCKYIGKQGDKPGGRWYYSGGDLQRPAVEFADVSIREAVDLAPEGGVHHFDVPEAGLSFVLVRTRPVAREEEPQWQGWDLRCAAPGGVSAPSTAAWAMSACARSAGRRTKAPEQTSRFDGVRAARTWPTSRSNRYPVLIHPPFCPPDSGGHFAAPPRLGPLGPRLSAVGFTFRKLSTAPDSRTSAGSVYTPASGRGWPVPGPGPGPWPGAGSGPGCPAP